MNFFGIGDLAYSLIAQVFFGISWLLALIAGFLVSFEAYVVQFILGISIQITTSPIVSTGFPIMLSIANLAFVLGLIVIAIATILRLQSYGIKQILWKLLVMAVVVNFGLVIAGTILQFSDNITLFMVKSIVPTRGGVVSGDSFANLSEFASIMAGAFNPQVGFLQSADSIRDPLQAKDLNQGLNVVGADFGKLVRPIIGLLLTSAQLSIILIVLGAFAVILLMRYVKLAFALITLPLAWAAWPFPAFKSQATKWWTDFLKQAFYPIPIIFFLWLGLIVAQGLHDSVSLSPTSNITNNEGPLGAVTAVLGGFGTPIALNFLNIMVVSGVMIMGLFAAEKMGASFAKNGHNAIKAMQGSATKAITSRIQRTGQRAGKAVQQKTLDLQKLALETKQRIVAPIEQAQNRLFGRNPGELHMNGNIVNKNGELLEAGTGRSFRGTWDATTNDYERDAAGRIIDSVSRTGVDTIQATFDHHKNDWKRDDQGNLVDASGQSYHNSRVHASGGVLDTSAQTGVAGSTRTLTAKELNDLGLVKKGKPVAQYIDYRRDASGTETFNLMATPTSAHLQHQIDEIDDGTTGKKLAWERQELREAAAHSGVMGSVADVIGDTAKEFAKNTGGHGGSSGHAEPKKKDDKKGDLTH